MTLSRARNLAVFLTALMAFQLSTQIVRLVETDGKSPWLWIGVVAFAVLTALGVVAVVKAVRAIHAFEAENGRDAGRQKPVERP